MNAWLQECPACGLVAPNLQEEPVDDLDVLKSPEYLSTRSDQALPALARRFVCRAIIAAARRDSHLAFSQMLSAAWVADDAKVSDVARTCRLKAAEYLGDQSKLSLRQRVQLLDVLRRAGAWEPAEELATSLTSDQLDDKLKTIVAFQAALITRRDHGCYKVEDAFPKSSPQPSRERQETPAPTSLIARLRRWISWSKRKVDKPGRHRSQRRRRSRA